MMNHLVKSTHSALALILSVTLGSCALQPEVIKARHYDLNEAISETTQEQLLLNIVRLRYDETPYFLQVSSITTSFSAGANIGASATLPEEAPNVFGLSGGFSYSETPTVTWAIPDSREFLDRLHAPMGADQLSVLMQGGLDPALVLRLGLKTANRLRNLQFTVSDGIYEPATFDEFLEALDLVEELQREGVIDLSYGVYSTSGGGTLPLSQMDPRGMADALPYGMQFMTRDDPDAFEPLKLSKPLFLKFSKQSDSDPRALRLRELLDLDAATYSFGIVDTSNSSQEQLLSESGRLSAVLDPDQKLTEIVVNNRSIMEVLRLTSAYVEVPPETLERGAVRERKAPEETWLDIKFARAEPSNAWLKVRRGGGWYYIAEDDLTSRVSFSFLNALFASVVGDVPGAKPLLTIPVK